VRNGYDKTWAEMTDEEVRETSMRSMALKKLEAYLKRL
jgi:inosine/xanthosine triphosphate pyrophosphatase family protein